MIADKIRTIRLNLGMSMDEFGKHLSPVATKGTISKWENGRYIPNNTRLQQIADLGDTTTEDLLNDKVPNDFHVILKQLRMDKGLTQKQLGSLINKKESTVRMWELNKNEPSLSTLIKLADIFNVSLDTLVGR